jgi:gamma-glutamyl-gamma-aminobutyrate hydrolase PuuD
MSKFPSVALIVRPGEPAEQFVGAINHGGGMAVQLGVTDSLPDTTGGLLIAGVGAYLDSENVPLGLLEAIEDSCPVLGIGWGMHALNVAMGGQPPVKTPGHSSDGKGLCSHPLFMAPGGKVGYTIAGSGWVMVPSDHTHGLLPAQVANGLLSSVYAGDQVVEAIEKPGREWFIGVQWPAHLVDTTPAGFDSLLLALVERSERRG